MQLLQTCYKNEQSLIFMGGGGCYDKGSYVDIFVYQNKVNKRGRKDNEEEIICNAIKLSHDTFICVNLKRSKLCRRKR